MGQWLHRRKPGGIEGEVSYDEADADSDKYLSASELSALTKTQIRGLAESLNITITATQKAAMIAQFLIAEDDDHAYTQEELEAMDLNVILALAQELSYTITETEKADVITEFLTEQAG